MNTIPLNQIKNMKNYFTIILLLSIFCFQTKSTIASENNQTLSYKVDDKAVDDLFESSNDITFTAELGALVLPSLQQTQDDDKQTLAGIVALGSWLLGVGVLIPIHRLILGTGNQAGKIIALYCVTLSGCGFILLIDGIMLLIDSGGNKYIENSKFIMWQ